MLLDIINNLPTEVARELFTELYIDAVTVEEELVVLSWIDEYYESRAKALSNVKEIKVNVCKDGWVTAVA